MQYVEAFNSFGYDIPNARQDWSADRPDGICITLWKSEVEWTPPPPRMDLWERAAPGATEWENLPGHRKRSEHLRRAVTEFEGWVDAIIVTGTPGEGYGNAVPWLTEQRVNHRWRVQKFDQASGWFAVAAEKLK